MMNNTLIRLVTLISTVLATASGLRTAIAAAGDLYSGGLSAHAIYRITPTGTRTTFVAAPGGPFADSLAFDNRGNLFVSDTQTNTIVKITPAGTQSTFATGLVPAGLAFDASGNLFAADPGSGSIFKYTPGGTRTTFATSVNGPFGLAFDIRTGNLFVSETNTGSILKFTPTGTKTTFASGLNAPLGLTFDNKENLYEVDFSSGHIFKFSATGVKTTFASSLSAPRHVAADRNGNIFATNFGTQEIFKFTPDGTQTTFASGSIGGGLAFEPATAALVNISTRLFVQTGNNVAIGGFIITGTDMKKVIIRGIGPSLPNTIANRLANPTLELHNAANAIIATNDNWKDSQQAEIQATGIPPSNDLESAIVITLAPGSYSVVLAGQSATTGVGLVELYDLDATVNAPLANIATRGFVRTGQNVMIGGFILNGGNATGRVIVRAIGPSLPNTIASRLADPTLELHDVNGALVASNDNWKTSQQAAIEATTIPPSNDLESAIVATLPAGAYSAIVAGTSGGTGVALVEVYNLH